MRSIIILLLTILYMGSGFIGLLPHRMNRKYYCYLTIHLFITYTLLTPWGQWLTLPLVLGSLTIVYFGCEKKIWNVILSLTGYLLAILANHLLTIPLSLLGLTLDKLSTQHGVAFLLAVNLVTIILIFFTRKIFVSPKLTFLQESPRKIQLIFFVQLLLCIGLIATNFVYGDIVGYPTEVLAYNGIIISIFTLFTIIIFYFLCQILQENYKLKLQKKEHEVLNDYAERMESFYEEFRIFRHDYKNILSTLSYYIKENDLPRLQEYFITRILPSGELLSSSSHVIGKLHMIKIPSIKSILYSKLINSLNRGLSPTLELTEPVNEIFIDELNLSRILGILLDNAIESAIETSEKIFSIAIITTENSILFSITNSCLPLEVPVSKLYEKGYSTKENHDGLGLYTVKKITDSLDHVSYAVQYNGLFQQILEIKKGN